MILQRTSTRIWALVQLSQCDITEGMELSSCTQCDITETMLLSSYVQWYQRNREMYPCTGCDIRETKQLNSCTVWYHREYGDELFFTSVICERTSSLSLGWCDITQNMYDITTNTQLSFFLHCYIREKLQNSCTQCNIQEDNHLSSCIKCDITKNMQLTSCTQCDITGNKMQNTNNHQINCWPEQTPFM